MQLIDFLTDNPIKDYFNKKSSFRHLKKNDRRKEINTKQNSWVFYKSYKKKIMFLR